MDRAPMTKSELITATRTWIGVPYQHQGRSRIAVDCAGMLQMMLTETHSLPKNFHAPKNYGRIPTGELREVIERYCTPAPAGESGSIALIVWPGFTEPSHLGLLTEEGTIIHCYERVGKVVEHGYREPWVRMTYGCYRLPGVTYE